MGNDVQKYVKAEVQMTYAYPHIKKKYLRFSIELPLIVSRSRTN